MSRNINLLAKNRVQNKGQQKLLLILRRIAIFSLIVTAGTSLLFFILTLSPALSNIKQQENTLLQNLNFSQKKIAKYLFVQNRITDIAKILAARYPIDSALSTIQDQLTQDAAIDSIDITGKQLVLKVSSPSLDSLHTVVDNVTNMVQAKKFFKDITIQEISTDDTTQIYTLNLEADLL